MVNATLPVRTMNEHKTPQLRLVPTGVGNEPRRHRRGRAYLEALVGIVVLSAVSFYAALGLLRGKNSVPPPSGEITTVTPMADAIIQNTPGKAKDMPSECPRATMVRGLLQACRQQHAAFRFHSGYGKGQVYLEAGTYAYSSPDGSITIANAKTYIHLGTTREWVLVQDRHGRDCRGSFFADFSPSPASR